VSRYDRSATEGGLARTPLPSADADAPSATFPHKGGRKSAGWRFERLFDGIVVPACAAFACAIVSACGLHPLYATNPVDGGGARQVFSSIYVDPIAGENIGYELRNSLIDGLEGTPKPTQAAYRLRVTVSQYLQGIAVANNAVVTRYNYTLDANYELSDIRTNKVLKSGIEETLSAYDVVTSPYATLRAQKDAQLRSAQDVAVRIRMDLSAYFAKHPAAK